MTIDFACKTFPIENIIRCGFNLTKGEMKLFQLLLKEKKEFFTTDILAKRLNFSQSAVQRGVKKLHEQDIIKRIQHNLDGGGYEFQYQIQDKRILKEKVIEKVSMFMKTIEKEIDHW